MSNRTGTGEFSIVLGERLRRFRLARGMSLDDLHAAIGGLVSKQALSKYERGKMRPKVTILNRIASTLGVKSTQLWGESVCHVEWIAFRKRANLRKKEQEQLESIVAELMEKRLSLQKRIGELESLELPIQDVPVSSLDDAEAAAMALRRQWGLGAEPIPILLEVLEARGIHIIEVDADEKFDGVSAVARDGEGNVLAAAIATRRGTSGDRHRLNVAHELGHLILNPDISVDAEKAAFRFGAAFLAPAEGLYRELGEKGRRIRHNDLLYLKWHYGISIQAILFRLRDLGLITNSHFQQWWIEINKSGWRTREPIDIPRETPKRFHRQVYRALSDELIEEWEADQLLNDSLTTSSPRSLIERRAFLQLPTDLRRNLLKEQAKQMADYYEANSEWREIEGGDFVEEEST